MRDSKQISLLTEREAPPQQRQSKRAAPSTSRHPAPGDRQYELFCTFLGDPAGLSNTLHLYDAIPKFSVSARRQALERQANGNGILIPFDRTFLYHSQGSQRPETRTCRIQLFPARFKREGGWIDVLPSADEELVYEVVLKLFADSRLGRHSTAGGLSTVGFTLRGIARELELRGKTRSIREIRHSIQVLSQTHMTLFVGDMKKPVYDASLITDVMRREAANLDIDADATWVVRLPQFVTEAVDAMQFRQINYATLMAMQLPLARWLYRQLSVDYRNASLTDPYKLRFSRVHRDSAMLEHSRFSANRKMLETALDELVDRQVLLGWETIDIVKVGNRVADLRYELQAHPGFVADVKRANARNREHLQLLGVGARSVS